MQSIATIATRKFLQGVKMRTDPKGENYMVSSRKKYFFLPNIRSFVRSGPRGASSRADLRVMFGCCALIPDTCPGVDACALCIACPYLRPCVRSRSEPPWSSVGSEAVATRWVGPARSHCLEGDGDGKPLAGAVRPSGGRE